MFVILFGGWTGRGVASLKHNGKANATLTVESDETESEFLKNLERTIGGYNDDSGDSDYIKQVLLAQRRRVRSAVELPQNR